MPSADEMERLRIRADLKRDLRRVEVDNSAPAWIGRVTTAAPAVGHFLKVVPQFLAGKEGEGITGVLTDAPGAKATIVYLIGPGIPATADVVLVRWTDYRWSTKQTEPGGGTSPPPPPFVTLPGCSCTSIPATLSMSVVDHLTVCGSPIPTCPACSVGEFYPCTLVYGPTPSQFSALGLGANCFLSTSDFQDPTQTPPFGLFRYTIQCSGNALAISRIYEPVPSAGRIAFRDSAVYTWAIGVTGNTCSPFLLSNGIIFAGGNGNCQVIISQ